MLRVFLKLHQDLQYHPLIIRAISSSPSEQKILVRDSNINYVRSGSGQKAVLLMPGALGSAWTDFRPQIEKLPEILENSTIYAWDPPGYGKSIPRKRNFTVDFYEKDAQAAMEFMNELSIQKYSLLGWSDGGISAMILSANYPQNVEKLVIWGSNAYVLPSELKIYESIRDVKKWSEKMRKPLDDLYGADYFASTWSNWIDIFAKIMKERGGDLCKSKLDKIIAGTLILHGVKDPMISPEHVPYLLKNIKGSK